MKPSNFVFNIFQNKLQNNYNWQDLHEHSKRQVLKQSLNFQGNQLELCQIMDTEDEVLNQFPLNEVLRLTKLVITSFGDEISSSFKTDF